MAPNNFLFVNKHSKSPSLSRNTGSEASLASKVNKHVQQQRFWKASGPRQNWYRPFVKSESSGPSTPSEIFEDVIGSSARSSPEIRRSASPRRSRKSLQDQAACSKTSCPSPTLTKVVKRGQPDALIGLAPSPRVTVSSRPGDINDPFSMTFVAITAEVREALDRHLRWVVRSSVSDFAAHGAIPRIFEQVLTNEMHAVAFLAMATAQQRKTTGMILPHEYSPEHYTYEATRLIRQYLEDHPDDTDPHAFADIFRVAMTEWINGNTQAARIHFSYIAKRFQSFHPGNTSDRHLLEVVSSEDVFLAIDIEEKPLLALTWEPELPVGPLYVPMDPPSDTDNVSTRSGVKLLGYVADAPLLKDILDKCLGDLQRFPNFSDIDFASSTAGPIWTMKRRIHATLHRLQIMSTFDSRLHECIRRTLVILLFLCSTTPIRRVGRTDVARLASRLQMEILGLEQTKAKTGEPVRQKSLKQSNQTHLQLWMYITGYAASKETSMNDCTQLRRWYRNRAIRLVMQVCGPRPTVDQLQHCLREFLVFKNVSGHVVQEVCAAVAEQSQSQTQNGHRVVQSLDLVL